jgi:hypothetical protein
MNRLSTIITAAAVAATLGLGTIQPAKADQQSTDEVILGAAAVVAGIATYANVQHKQALAKTDQGYTPWGATVYEDGHVVLPNGQTYYPNNVGQQIACNGSSCQILQNGVAVGYGGYGPGYNTGYNNGYYGNGNGYNNNGYNTGYNNQNSGGYYQNGVYYPYGAARRPAVVGTYSVVHPVAVVAASRYVAPVALARSTVVTSIVRHPVVAVARPQAYVAARITAVSVVHRQNAP